MGFLLDDETKFVRDRSQLSDGGFEAYLGTIRGWRIVAELIIYWDDVRLYWIEDGRGDNEFDGMG